MFKVVGVEIYYGGLSWCPWLTLSLTPAMLDGLVAELNEAMIEAENSGYENGHSDGYNEGFENGEYEGYSAGEDHANDMNKEKEKE